MNFYYLNDGAQSPDRPAVGGGDRRRNPAARRSPAARPAAREGPLGVDMFMVSCATAFLAVVGLVGCAVGTFDYLGTSPTLEACLLAGVVGGCGSCLGLSVIMLWGRRVGGIARIIAADFGVSALIVTAFCLGGGLRVGVIAVMATDGALALGVLSYIARIRRDIREARQPRHGFLRISEDKERVQRGERRLDFVRAIGSRANSADVGILGGCAIGAALGTALGTAISLYTGNGPAAGVGIGIGVIAGAAAWLTAVLYPREMSLDEAINSLLKSGSSRQAKQP